MFCIRSCVKTSLLVLTTLFALCSFSAASQNSIDEFTDKVAAHKGKVIYVDFWASWCVPCRRSFPWMNEMQKQYGDKGFKVLSINLDANKKHADRFLAQYPANFDVLYDPKGKIARKYQLKGMPSSFLINKQGKVVSSHVGFTDEKKNKYQQEILALLAEN